MNSLVSFQMRTLCIDFSTSWMITKMDSPFFQIGIIPSIVLDFDDKFTAIYNSIGVILILFILVIKAAFVSLLFIC